MMHRFEIEIAPDGETQLRFVLTAPVIKTPIAGKAYTRPQLPNLSDALQSLRFGDASDQVVNEVTAKISEWLLSNDLNGQLETALNMSEGEPIRLIFSINDPRLRESLADVPFELLMLNGGLEPLVLSPGIASIIHILPNSGPSSRRSGNWPLKILIVRSNPKDLGGAIPAAAPIRDSINKILAEEPALNPGLVRIDILSSEDASLAGLPTQTGLENQLRGQYDILVYLGHGDISSDVSGIRRVGGVLQLEDETGDFHRAMDARKLSDMLREPNPVPVVLLLGCLTAAENIPPEMREGVRQLLPQWLRGSQGVAQVLIDSSSGVQLVVGMRYKIDTQDAIDFLDFFFRNLLKTTPGNVEAAVRSARRKLANKTYMWSAPVIFSKLTEEPLFPFIEEPPECPRFEVADAVRNTYWKILAGVNWNLRERPELKGPVTDWEKTLDQTELDIAGQMKAHGANLIAPGFGQFKPGEEIKLPIKLTGTLKNIEEIEGKISVGGGQVQISKLEASEHLIKSNYELTSLDNNSGFLIRRNGGGLLETGDLFTILVTVPPGTQGILSVSTCKIKTKPIITVCPGDNAIILPAP